VVQTINKDNFLAIGVDTGVIAIGVAVLNFSKVDSVYSLVKGLLILEGGKKDTACGVLRDRVLVKNAQDVTLGFYEAMRDGWLGGIIPDIAVIEKGVYAGYASELLVNAGWCGAVLYGFGIPILFANPMTVKKEIIGNGRADKRTVEVVLKKRLGLKANDKFLKYGEHFWDAVLYAMAGCRILLKELF
jgi:Holliday junction resolvasome RuvABC endonuclease subunit